MEFKTEWNYEMGESPAGSMYEPTYTTTIDKKGKTVLKEAGQRNVYEEIQEAAKGTSVYEIIDKYLQTGDESLLNKRKGIFANFINIPKSPMEINQLCLNAELQFEQLDREIREEFENDVGVFKQSILDGSFEDRVARFIGEKTKAQKAAEITAQMENQKSEVKKGE